MVIYSKGGCAILLLVLCVVITCPTNALVVSPPVSFASSGPLALMTRGHRQPHIVAFRTNGFHHDQATIRYQASASSSSSSLALYPDIDPTTFLLSSVDGTESTTALETLAVGLGYLLGAASILLYTPIAVRILRTKSADGLTVSTWWLKLTSYTCTDVSLKCVCTVNIAAISRLQSNLFLHFNVGDRCTISRMDFQLQPSARQ